MSMWLQVVFHPRMFSDEWQQGGWGEKVQNFLYFSLWALPFVLPCSMFSRGGFLSRYLLGDPAVTLLVQVLSPLPLCTSPSNCAFRNIYKKNLLLLPFLSDSEAVILPCWDLLCCTGPVRSCCVCQSRPNNIYFFHIMPIFSWNLKKLISCLHSLSPVDFLLWICSYQKVQS